MQGMPTVSTASVDDRRPYLMLLTLLLLAAVLPPAGAGDLQPQGAACCTALCASFQLRCSACFAPLGGRGLLPSGCMRPDIGPVTHLPLPSTAPQHAWRQVQRHGGECKPANCMQKNKLARAINCTMKPLCPIFSCVGSFMPSFTARPMTVPSLPCCSHTSCLVSMYPVHCFTQPPTCSYPDCSCARPTTPMTRWSPWSPLRVLPPASACGLGKATRTSPRPRSQTACRRWVFMLAWYVKLIRPQLSSMPGGWDGAA